MSSTVKYKGNTLMTVTNQIRKLLTAGKYLEDDITIEDVTSGSTSPWTKVGETWELTLEDYTSTSAVTAGSKSYGTSIVNKDKIIWVRIRDKAGKRAGYFIGSDCFFINANKANGSTSTFATAGRIIHRYTTSNAFGTYSGACGVYGYSISNAGALTLRKCYNANYSLKIEGTYLIDVFTLDYPSGYPSIFDITAVTT